MMRKLVLSFVAASAALVAAPAVGQAPVRHVPHRDISATVLNARIASINARIDMLSEEDALGREEARELRAQARRLQLRLYGMGRREAGDVELGIDRLESQVRFASDDARLGGHAFNRDFDDRYDELSRDEHDRYDAHPDFKYFDPHVGSSVDRWHDPFDRGNNP